MSEPTKTELQVVHWSSRLKVAGGKSSADSGGDEDANKRWASRKAANIPAYIYADNLPAALACIIRDTSSSGARIQLSDKVTTATVDDVPETFRIVVMRHREYTSVSCKIVRRFGDSIGIRYTSQFETVVKPLRKLNGRAKR